MQINDLIKELIDLRTKHGNIKIGTKVELGVVGISYQYLLVMSNLPTLEEVVSEERT